MKNSFLRWLTALSLCIALVTVTGCDSGKNGTDNSTTGGTTTSKSATMGNSATGTADNKNSEQAAGGTALTPANANIGFIGTHGGKDPDPEARVGSFEKFTGKIDVDATAKTVKALNFEIDVASLKTAMGKLDDHLRTEDFFDVRNHPTAKFVMTELKSAAEGGKTTHELVGDLTIMGNTKSVSIPVDVEFAGDLGVKISGETKIKRSEFGMNKMLDKVTDDVAIKLAIGA